MNAVNGYNFHPYENNWQYVLFRPEYYNYVEIRKSFIKHTYNDFKKISRDIKKKLSIQQVNTKL